MATPAQRLLRELSEHGIGLSVSGDRIQCRPRSAMTPELVDQVVQLKPQLRSLLTATGARHERAKRLATYAVTRAVPLRLLSVVLETVSCTDPALSCKQERLGIAAGQVWASYVAGEVDERALVRALDRWSTVLQQIARRHEKRFGVVMGRASIWSFWVCYTEKDESESCLSRFLRGEVGYPKAPEHRRKRGPCYACRQTRSWRLRAGGSWVCGGCHPPSMAEALIEWRENPGGRHG